MSKIICDICGTTYQDTAECCPICGCSRDAAASMLGEDIVFEETQDLRTRGGRFSAKKKKEIFDYDEANAEPEEPMPEEDPYGEEPVYEEPPRHNTVAVILLTVLIAVLLLGAGFFFVRYYLPNMGQKDAQPTETSAQTDQTEPSATEYSIPCTNLVLTSGKAELTNEGNYHLLNVVALPENTTDEIIYTSADESIATVSENGRITAVSEGETVIYITCGNIQQVCPVVCRFTVETQPETEATEAAAGETEEQTEQTTAPTSAPDVVLKLEKTDVMLGVYYEFQLKLDCDLEQNQVTWTSEHPHIATVDENGVVKALKSGTTAITAKYGDQEVSCIVRGG